MTPAAVTLALVATLVAPLGVGLLLGVDRRMTAAMQLRVGPPLLQPLYDLTKLVAKRSPAADRLSAGLVAGQAILAAGAFAMVLGGGDILVAALVLGVARVLFILAAGAVDSPYAQLGVGREVVLLVAAEPLLIMTVVAYGVAAGSFASSDVASHEGLVLGLPTLGVTLGVLLAIALRKSPFDLATSHHAHQELVKGSTTEMAGPWLALAELGHWYEAAMVLALVALASVGAPLIAAGLVALSYVVAVVLDNTVPRATWRAAIGIAWGVGGTAAVVALAMAGATAGAV
ncbi:MAG TPA: NADH-quinone oxidoreductase subunit H [Candidatus Limnocylindrales bacterium]|nr:NADH-quinone oxidoreductase subunit H [Candidatus Limnocylindrales bacterium]